MNTAYHLAFIQLLASLLGPRSVLARGHVALEGAVSGEALVAVGTLVGLLACTREEHDNDHLKRKQAQQPYTSRNRFIQS